MIDILNHLSLDAASLGNHDFDFGVATMLERVGESNFPWVNVNLLNKDGGLMEGTQRNLVKELRWFRVRGPFSHDRAPALLRTCASYIHVGGWQTHPGTSKLTVVVNS